MPALLYCFSADDICFRMWRKKEPDNVSKPNVIIVYLDDLGIGDLSCYGATAVKTPNVDKLAAGGIKFTDAHSTASTCTPSRYSLLTGSYAFRNNAAITW
ncbi:sulfatase-like hydrolase/transferase [Niabella ginsengisoli]|uniref:sulfatase-like hydrolase/transferase n=1 Tax=Niabella ginsengisoli TaxID=522298 RepID=UPI0021D3F2F9|nr:sulfatase-like hydrolase/transferase [Niabella ginsengisoli]